MERNLLDWAFLLGASDDVKLASDSDKYVAGFIDGVVKFFDNPDFGKPTEEE